MIEFDDFARVDMRVGRVLSVEPFPEARKASYKLRIDFGPEVGERGKLRPADGDLPGSRVAGRDDRWWPSINFPPRRIAGFASEVLVLGAMGDDGDVWLLCPEPEAPIGSRIG